MSHSISDVLPSWTTLPAKKASRVKADEAAEPMDPYEESPVELAPNASKDASGGEEADKPIELRVSTMPTAFGEKAVLRIFDPDVVLNRVDQLGFSPADLAVFYPYAMHRLKPDRLTAPPHEFATAVAELAPGVAVRVLAPGESVALGD